MSKKSAKIAELVSGLACSKDGAFDARYLGYFECFNQQQYYEAHDVLEDLWLKTKGGLHFFYKGLIQLAGAFVHLKKSKLNPAARLYRLALKNLEPYPPLTEGLDLAGLITRIHAWLEELEKSDYTRSPYDPANPPKLELKS